ncbi:hypothetical protein ECZU41_46220 [Escherichia coli]|nr:cytochrome b/b6 domain-containing protein [Escherichia coli]ESD02395.1 hypothetical protein HMPREF1593_00146 [Escherichia coli 907391]ESD47006.1 hypothetical protein HMPREF1602_01244 [Escherichia coli 907889]ESE37815.1 hypothetical protein HMPREF1621_00512 [Escherichia coli A25922R]ESD89477.1 hypothetical protein HMPREF1611_01036 [Escherichia coli 908573]GHL29457.1 hypothetical protein ECZU26_02820 [Escherichia coli]
MDLTERIPYAGTVWKAASYEYAGIQYGAKSRLYSVILDGAALLLSGLVLWKPVQFSLLTILFGGYDTVRYIHFLCMNIMVLFIIIHLVMVLLVPRALLSMIRGH